MIQKRHDQGRIDIQPASILGRRTVGEMGIKPIEHKLGSYGLRRYLAVEEIHKLPQELSLPVRLAIAQGLTQAQIHIQLQMEFVSYSSSTSRPRERDTCQRRLVQLDVKAGRAEGAVTEEVGHILQSRVIANHVCGGRLAETMAVQTSQYHA